MVPMVNYALVSEWRQTRVSKATGFASFPWVLGCHGSDKAWFLSGVKTRVPKATGFSSFSWLPSCDGNDKAWFMSDVKTRVSKPQDFHHFRGYWDAMVTTNLGF